MTSFGSSIKSSNGLPVAEARPTVRLVPRSSAEGENDSKMGVVDAFLVEFSQHLVQINQLVNHHALNLDILNLELSYSNCM